MIEREPAIDTIRYAILAHLFLEGTALGIGAIEYGEVGIVASLLSAYALDVIADDDGFLLVTISRLILQVVALVVATIYVLLYLSFVMPYQTVGSLNDALCGTVVLLELEELDSL